MKEIYFYTETDESELYRVSDQPSLAALSEKLSQLDLQEYLDLHERAQGGDRGIVEAIEAFRDHHAHVPEVYNLLGYAYARFKRTKEAEKLIFETHEKFPDYLFGKINYADQCLRAKNAKEIPRIFPQFSLSALYPERKQFHISEFRGFMVVVGFYHLAIKKKERAKEYLRCAKEVDPHHLSVKLLEKRLSKVSLVERLRKLRGWLVRR